MPIAAGGFGNDITINVIASVIASAILLAAGFLLGKYKERQRFGKKLEEYDFYPYATNRDNFPEFSLKDFRLGMHYFLRNFDPIAARQLIFIGEQNNVRAQLEPAEQKVYARLFARYEGKKIADDTREYLENFIRIVRLLGKSFPNLGIEILLHDLSNPSRSLVALENNVTGRNLHDGTTNLVIDLKKRQVYTRGEIELRAEHRRAASSNAPPFPIMRKEYGVVGAICVNVDTNYLTEEVLSASDKVVNFFQTFCRTDMQLDENILSRDEYAKALKGKRHFKDERFE